ncbi:MAG: flagellin lysine-N-methylase [Acidobacteriota bacterium]|nr:flagellin lysine-N-methylase [Acidobacteriota bacterium]
MVKPIVAASYMNRFRCIGPDCEDTCCQGWRVNLPRDDYDKISLIGKEAADPRFGEALKLIPEEERQDHNWGYLQHNDCGQCPLMEEGWCLLHRDHGEASLPVVCATFPRLLLPRSDHIELHGRLSCPEVARLTIPADDPTRPVPYEHELPEVFEIQYRLDDDHGYYQRDLETLTLAIEDLLNLPEFSLKQRLYFTAYLIKRVDNFVVSGASRDTQSRLDRSLKRMSDPQFLNRICSEVDAGGHLPANLVHFLFGVLNAQLHGPRHGRYNRLRLAALKHLARNLDSEQGQTGILDSAVLDDLVTAYRELETEVTRKHGERVNRYFENFSRVYWACYLYMGDPNLTIPLHKFLIYLALIRILFFSDPRQKELEAGEEGLDVVIVEVIQVFMKTIDANLELLKPILGGMETLNLGNVSELAAFLRV